VLCTCRRGNVTQRKVTLSTLGECERDRGISLKVSPQIGETTMTDDEDYEHLKEAAHEQAHEIAEEAAKEAADEAYVEMYDEAYAEAYAEAYSEAIDRLSS
jgi:hypothetical protein